MEIIDKNEAIIHLIYPLTDYIIGDGRIEIPTGVLGYDAEGIASRRIRVWNTLGQSEPSEEKFSVITGPPVVTSTTFDGLPFDRDEPLSDYRSWIQVQTGWAWKCSGKIPGWQQHNHSCANRNRRWR